MELIILLVILIILCLCIDRILFCCKWGCYSDKDKENEENIEKNKKNKIY